MGAAEAAAPPPAPPLPPPPPPPPLPLVLPPGVAVKGNGGRHLALQLRFSLPSAAYATMAIRELTKTSTATAYQKGLNEGGGTCH